MFKLLNLQLFAETQTTLLEGLSVENKTHYDNTLIDIAGPNLVHDQFAITKDIPKNGGKTIEFRRFAQLPKASQPLTEGVTPPGKSLNATAITATVAQYGDFIVQSDMLELTALDNTVLEALKILGRQAGATLDTVTRNALQTGTNVTYCPKVSNGVTTAVTSRKNLDTTARLTVDVVKKAVAKLRGQNAPKIDGDYVAIIHPYVAYDLMSDPHWIEAHKYATPENIYKGEIGKIAGVRFVETTEAKVYNDDTCPANGDGKYHSVFTTLFLGDDAYATTKVTGGGLETFIKQKGSSGVADAINQRSSVGWKATKTAELLVDAYLIRVESCSPEFDETPAN